jgi:hypothetical protein
MPTAQIVHASLAPALHEPAAHLPLHELVVAATPPYRPASQAAHNVRPSSVWYLPAGHAAQCDELLWGTRLSPMRPVGHVVQTLELAALYRPGAHAAHSACSSSPWNFPGGHVVHSGAAPPANLPVRQPVHALAAAALFVEKPSAQSVQLVIPALPWNLPTGQAAQCRPSRCGTSSSPHRPAAQIVHALALAALNWPYAQAAQDCAPPECWYLPGGHVLHVGEPRGQAVHELPALSAA